MDDVRQRRQDAAPTCAHKSPDSGSQSSKVHNKPSISLYGRIMRLIGKSFGSTLGCTCLLLAFTVVGAMMFVAVEAPQEQSIRFKLTKERLKTIEQAKKLIGGSKDLTKFTQQLDKYRDKLTDAFGQGVTSDIPLAAKWTFWGGVFYCLTVYTTIGYGNIAPSTTIGKLLTLVYSIVGIPLCLIVLAKIGKFLTRLLRTLWIYPRLKMSSAEQQEPVTLFRVYSRAKEEFDFPIVIALLVTFIYMILGALLYCNWESWSYLDAVYFIFVSISTIGFGDILPEEPYFFLLSSIYIFFGLALVSMVLNVVMEEMEKKVVAIQSRLESSA